jgi:hypothetical protein
MAGDIKITRTDRARSALKLICATRPLPGKKCLEEKHKTKGKRRAWCKLHLGLDLVSGQIVCSDLTTDDIGEPTVKALTDRFGALIEVTIPPPKNDILSPDEAQNPSIRDRHIAEIEAHSRMVW